MGEFDGAISSPALSVSLSRHPGRCGRPEDEENMSLRHAFALTALCLLAPAFADSDEVPQPPPIGRLVEDVHC